MALRIAVLLLLCPMLAACVEVLDKRPYGIWIEKPVLGLADPDRVAAEHCAEYGRTAVKTGTLGSDAPRENYLPFLSYSCE